MSIHPFFAEEFVRRISGLPSQFVEKDPASAPTLPGHGSTHRRHDMPMNSCQRTPQAADAASETDWFHLATSYEAYLERIRLLAGVADDLCEAHPDVPHREGQITMRAETFFQVCAMIETIAATAKRAMEPTR